MKLQNWNKITGIAKKIAKTKASLKGVRKGEATPMAIILVPSGISSRNGAETKAYNSFENGKRRIKLTRIANRDLSNLSRSSVRWATRGMGGSLSGFGFIRCF